MCSLRTSHTHTQDGTTTHLLADSSGPRDRLPSWCRRPRCSFYLQSDTQHDTQPNVHEEEWIKWMYTPTETPTHTSTHTLVYQWNKNMRHAQSVALHRFSNGQNLHHSTSNINIQCVINIIYQFTLICKVNAWLAPKIPLKSNTTH